MNNRQGERSPENLFVLQNKMLYDAVNCNKTQKTLRKLDRLQQPTRKKYPDKNFLKRTSLSLGFKIAEQSVKSLNTTTRGPCSHFSSL